MAAYLDPSTRRPLVVLLETQLLEPHAAALLDRGFTAMADADRSDDLRSLLHLLAVRHPSLPLAVDAADAASPPHPL